MWLGQIFIYYMCAHKYVNTFSQTKNTKRKKKGTRRFYKIKKSKIINYYYNKNILKFESNFSF